MASVLIAPPENARVSSSASDYLVFALGGKQYCIPFSLVSEIVSVEGVFKGAQDSADAKRTVQLRHKSIPAIDLRAKFGIAGTEWRNRTCVVVVEVLGENREIARTPVGIAVDSVVEVLELAQAEFVDPPGFRLAAPYASAMTTVRGKTTVLLDLDGTINWQGISARDLVAEC